ncbi:MAG: 4'-phosphopantetheinyl transferase superfamily protein [Oscillospiraceae bacterium]|nr:4'-phosphopantetheinyl transferase superfamily protein [Oscillospiraceae bacterium]
MLYTRVIDENNRSYAYEHSQSYELLFESVKKEKGIVLSFADVAKDEYGKPFFPEYPHIFFSITHCRGLACCIIDGSECGIDAEMICSPRDKVAKRVFSDSEFAEFEKRQGREREIFFTSIWTLKEAYSKAVGRGLAVIKNVSFYGNGGRILSNFPDFGFRQYMSGEHIISVCTRGNCPKSDLREYYPF